MTFKSNEKKQRRGFLSGLLKGVGALGLLAFTAPTSPEDSSDSKETDPWFNRIKGKRRMVFDVSQPHGIYPFAWTNVFLTTNAKTGTPEKDCSVVVVLRHTAIAYAFENNLWEKYKFGELFKVTNPLDNAVAAKNPFWQPKVGDYKVPGIGNIEIGINELQARGVMFCVCETAITSITARLAGSLNQDAAQLKKEWLNGLLPDIHLVPNGVWALGRAQEHGCGYCFAG